MSWCNAGGIRRNWAGSGHIQELRFAPIGTCFQTLVLDVFCKAALGLKGKSRVGAVGFHAEH